MVIAGEHDASKRSVGKDLQQNAFGPRQKDAVQVGLASSPNIEIHHLEQALSCHPNVRHTITSCCGGRVRTLSRHVRLHEGTIVGLVPGQLLRYDEPVIGVVFMIDRLELISEIWRCT